MIIGEVRTFPNVKPNKEQVTKILEEAAEIYSAWEHWNANVPETKPQIFRECADLIMATSNLLASLGVSDMTSYIKECEKIQELRGRYDPDQADRADRQYELIEKLRKQQDELYRMQGWYIPHDVQESD